MTAKVVDSAISGQAASSTEEHVVIFRLSEEYYAIDIKSVQEIVRMQSITSIPGSEDWVEGITNLRGRVVPVIDLRKRCVVPVAEHTAETRIVVVSGPTGMVGFVVDAVTEVLRIAADQIEFPSTIVSAPANSYLRGIAKLDDRLISLLDLDGLVPESGDESSDDGRHAVAA
jgi:purine-binding chemotaxis protein CheW